jgi:NTE family protein
MTQDSSRRAVHLGPPTFRRPRLGLALGGGGARGYAHIGLLRVLEREGIPIDYLAGTSMGGVIAAGLAIGMTAGQMESEALSMRTRRLMDITLSRMGLLEGKRVRQLFERMFGEREFADARIPLCLVAVDLNTGEEVTLSDGSLVDALRATISVPGIFCPAEWRGRLLVDGGIANNVPADVVRAMGAEVVIAVDVGAPLFVPLAEEAATRRIDLPGLARLNPLFGALIRSVNIMQAEILRLRLAQAHPDLVISPNIGPINIEELERAAEIIPAGQQAAELALPRIRQLMRKRLFWNS